MICHHEVGTVKKEEAWKQNFESYKTHSCGPEMVTVEVNNCQNWKNLIVIEQNTSRWKAKTPRAIQCLYRQSTGLKGGFCGEQIKG